MAEARCGRIRGRDRVDQSIAGAATAVSLCGLVEANEHLSSFARLHGRDARAYTIARYNLVVNTFSVRQVASADFPTRWGTFRIFGFEGASGEGTASPKDATRKEEDVGLV